MGTTSSSRRQRATAAAAAAAPAPLSTPSPPVPTASPPIEVKVPAINTIPVAKEGSSWSLAALSTTIMDALQSSLTIPSLIDIISQYVSSSSSQRIWTIIQHTELPHVWALMVSSSLPASSSIVNNDDDKEKKQSGVTVADGMRDMQWSSVRVPSSITQSGAPHRLMTFGDSLFIIVNPFTATNSTAPSPSSSPSPLLVYRYDTFSELWYESSLPSSSPAMGTRLSRYGSPPHDYQLTDMRYEHMPRTYRDDLTAIYAWQQDMTTSPSVAVDTATVIAIDDVRLPSPPITEPIISVVTHTCGHAMTPYDPSTEPTRCDEDQPTMTMTTTSTDHQDNNTTTSPPSFRPSSSPSVGGSGAKPVYHTVYYRHQKEYRYVFQVGDSMNADFMAQAGMESVHDDGTHTITYTTPQRTAWDAFAAAAAAKDAKTSGGSGSAQPEPTIALTAAATNEDHKNNKGDDGSTTTPPTERCIDHNTWQCYSPYQCRQSSVWSCTYDTHTRQWSTPRRIMSSLLTDAYLFRAPPPPPASSSATTTTPGDNDRGGDDDRVVLITAQYSNPFWIYNQRRHQLTSLPLRFREATTCQFLFPSSPSSSSSSSPSQYVIAVDMHHDRSNVHALARASIWYIDIVRQYVTALPTIPIIIDDHHIDADATAPRSMPWKVAHIALG